MQPLPVFRYHLDPVSTGVIIPTDSACECCGRSTGYTYSKNFYGEDEPEFICPWCIADGSAAEKFNGTFSDDHSLVAAGISQDIIDEVTKRTPGYVSWQGEYWLTCCNDACAFHGDESREYEADPENRARS